MKKTLLIFCLFTILQSCNKGLNNRTQEEKDVYNSCLIYILKENDIGLSNCYLVDPNYDSLHISSYFESPDIFFQKLFNKKDKEAYRNTENKINSDYFGKTNSYFETLKNCAQSNYLIKFSGIGENIVMAYVIEVANKINIDEFTQLVNKGGIAEDHYIFTLNEDSLEIEDVYIGGVDW